MKLRVDVLYFEGCPSGTAAYDLARTVVRSVGVVADVNLIEVTSDEMAREIGFLGSPSIRIDGQDIEPARRNDVAHSLSCRIYRTTSGAQGLPPEEMLAAALRAR